MGLDNRLLDMAIEIIKNSYPNDVHVQELYNYIEDNLELTQKQLDLHKQVLGQIEPNWKHDLRNLLASAKNNSILVNPKMNYWGFPRRLVGVNFDCDISFDKMLKRASKALTKNEQFECKRNGDILSVSTYAEEIITIEDSSNKKKNLLKSMACSKIDHLLNCGGRLPIGSLHKWANLESAIVFLCDEIEYDNSDIVFINRK